MELKKSNSLTFGFIGTFSYWHGVDVIESMIVEAHQQQLPVKFLLIGNGVLLPQLKNNLEKQNIPEWMVTFTGQTAQKDAPFYLSQCDVFLCPNQPNSDGTPFFGSPTKLFEYMAMAKPIIASDLEQLAEVVNPAVKVSGEPEFAAHNRMTGSEVGILVKPEDTQGFINAMHYCLQISEDDRKQMGTNARQKVIEQYTWKQHVKKIIEFANL